MSSRLQNYIFLFLSLPDLQCGAFSHEVLAEVLELYEPARILSQKSTCQSIFFLLSKMFVNGFKMMVFLGVIAAMMVVFRVPVNWNLVWAIPILIVMFLFTFGVGTIMMHYGVYVNDLGYITGIVLQMMMYLSGVFYSVAKRIPEPFGDVLESFNPLALFMSSMRSAILYCEAPRIWIIAVWTLISLILIALGIFTIYSNENSYVKVI